MDSQMMDEAYRQSAMNACAGTPRELSQAERLLALFDESLKRLAVAVGQLDVKLGPVLKDPYPRDDAKSAVREGFESGLLGGVSNMVSQLDDITDRIAELTQRVEL